MQSVHSRKLENWLSSANPVVFSTYCIFAAFLTYFCMYGFRKPFSVATYTDVQYFGLKFKALLVTSQLLGYALSKFLGIKVVSEVGRAGRALAILGLIGFAHVSLLLFAIVPAPYNAVCLFFNGLPLGIVYGMVLSFLEGRKVSEALVAGLCASFIFASGFSKSVGEQLLDVGVGMFWMPFLSGCVFIVPLIIGVWLLMHVPAQKEEECLDRSQRTQMMAADRKRFFGKYWQGITILTVLFVMLTVLRSWRDDFQAEIFQEMGLSVIPSTFARSEFLVAIVSTVIAGLTFLIANHRQAFMVSLILSGLSLASVLGCVILRKMEILEPFPFMVALGIAIYIPYVLFHTTLLERMIAVFKEPATVGFLMYIVDSAGYLGYLALVFLKTIPAGNGKTVLENWLGGVEYLAALDSIAMISFVVGVPLAVYSVWYFYQKTLPEKEEKLQTVPATS